jgi:hypothetical protein
MRNCKLILLGLYMGQHFHSPQKFIFSEFCKAEEDFNDKILNQEPSV